MAQEPLLQALTDFARTLTGRYEVGDVLDELASVTVEVVGAFGAGVSLGDADGRLQFATASDEAVRQLEEVQQRVQQGPCWAAYRSGQPTLVADIETIEQWPEYCEVCRRVEMRSVAGIPMMWNGQGFGALNIYREVPGEWTEEDTNAATVLADMATSYVAHASQLDQAVRLNEQLQAALESRVIIEQAKGLVAGERGVSLSEAFELLRRHARSHHASLRAVAAAVVEAGFRPDV
jgi:GAF domain-containing protein